MTATLRTRRLVLEPYVPSDEDAFVALHRDPRVARWMGDGVVEPESDVRELFGRIFTGVYAHDLFDVWAVRRHGTLIGHAELKPSTAVDGWEIVYALVPSSWGAGLGTETVTAVLGHGVEGRGLTEIHATVAAANVVSLTLLGRVGFTHVRNLDDDDGVRVLTWNRPATPS